MNGWIREIRVFGKRKSWTCYACDWVSLVITNVTILYLWKWSPYNIIFIIKKINVSEGGDWRETSNLASNAEFWFWL